MNRTLLLILCYGGMVSVAICLNLMPVHYTTFAQEFGNLHEEQLGRISALVFAGVVIGVLLSGPLADRFGAALFTCLGLLISGIGLLLISIARSYELLLVASVVAGFGAGILDMLMSPIVSAVCVDRRASALNHLHAFYCIGALATVLLASACMRLGISWRILAAAMALVPLALTGLLFLTDFPPLVHPERSRDNIVHLILRPRFFAALIIIWLIGATENGIIQWLPAFAERGLGFDKSMGGVAAGMFSLFMAGGRLAAPGVLKKMGSYGVLFAGIFLCIACYLLGTLIPVPAIALAACVLAGLACSVLWPTWLGITADIFPQGGASMFALLAALGNFGGLVVPWIIGGIAEHSSIRSGLLIGTLAPVFLALLAFFCLYSDKKTVSSP
ncbi:MAG: MFS transporter [Candidatus Hydrogenedens sp.]|nr:MFS transporter [Candidatus Hydrogenedens sp.]